MNKVDKLPSGSYRTRVYFTQDGEYKSKSFTADTAKEAKRQAAEFLSGVKAIEGRRLLLRDAMLQYIEMKSPVLSPSTLRGYKAYQGLYLLGLQKMNIYDITQADVQRAISKEATAFSPKTTRNIHGFLSAVFRMYRPDFVLTTTLPQRDALELTIPTEAEVLAILDHLGNNEAALPVMLAAYQGLRMSEILGLRWSCVDFENHTLRIQEARVLDADREYVSKKTKTTSGTRDLRMMDVVEEKLKNTPRSGEYVVNLKGQQIFNRYRRAQATLGLKYSFHELRHYACSVMIALGIPNKYIANFLGHKSELMVERVYGHVMSDKKDEFFDRLNGHFSRK